MAHQQLTSDDESYELHSQSLTDSRPRCARPSMISTPTHSMTGLKTFLDQHARLVSSAQTPSTETSGLLQMQRNLSITYDFAAQDLSEVRNRHIHSQGDHQSDLPRDIAHEWTRQQIADMKSHADGLYCDGPGGSHADRTGANATDRSITLSAKQQGQYWQAAVDHMREIIQLTEMIGAYSDGVGGLEYLIKRKADEWGQLHQIFTTLIASGLRLPEPESTTDLLTEKELEDLSRMG